MSDSTRPVDWSKEHRDFYEHLPRIKRYLNVAFSNLPPGRREDLVSQGVARVWEQWHSLVLIGKSPLTIGMYRLTRFAVLWCRAYCDETGRISKRCLEHWESGVERSPDTDTELASAAVGDDDLAFEIDFCSWLQTQDARTRQALVMWATGANWKDIADALGVSAPTVYAIRDRAWANYQEYVNR